MEKHTPKHDVPKCGICGKKKNLTRTECCGNWICDDENEYVPFSYARNSCSRNHGRYTLCGFHHTEGHPGHWKDCPECRKEFVTEMYVWYGTNEYNFEKLDNPPAYEPTRCAICGKVIKLGTDGYSQLGDEYRCERCMNKQSAPRLVYDRHETPAEEAGVPARSVKIGRNDPCPCGSGKKYKRCCYGKPEAGTSAEGKPAGNLLEELRKAMGEKEFGSLEEVQTFADSHVGRMNRAPLDDFAGLSSEQMHGILHFPFSSTDLVTFSPRLSAPPVSPMATLLDALLGAIGDEGLKATATGNLPLNFVRQTALAYFLDGEREYQPGIRSETDFFDLHVTRLVAGASGLIRKYRGKFSRTIRCRKFLGEGGMAAVYPLLLRAFVEKYNWAYRDYYPDFSIIQQSFLFSLWLFHRFGDEWRYPSFYEDYFLRAFPAILSEAPDEGDLITPEDVVRWCYAWRCIEGFAGFLGLVEIRWEDRGFVRRRFQVRKTGLLSDLVTFHL